MSALRTHGWRRFSPGLRFDAMTLLLLSLVSSAVNTQQGKASWYSHRTGTCAHKSLPMGTVVTVTNLTSQKTATCRVADRGPFVKGRIIDLDKSVFAKLAPLQQGIFEVEISW
jgi:rare lipoprotein A